MLATLQPIAAFGCSLGSGNGFDLYNLANRVNKYLKATRIPLASRHILCSRVIVISQLQAGGRTDCFGCVALILLRTTEELTQILSWLVNACLNNKIIPPVEFEVPRLSKT